MYSVSTRTAVLSSFGAFTWRIRTPAAVIRRVIASLRDDPRAIRGLALAWIEHEQRRGMSPATLALQWRTLAALVALVGRRLRIDGATLGARPRPDRRVLGAHGVADLIAALVADGRHRDAALVGLLGELGLLEREALALRARDALALRCSPQLTAAIAAAARDVAPQDVLIQTSRGRPLSGASAHAIAEELGTSVAALRRAAGE